MIRYITHVKTHGQIELIVRVIPHVQTHEEILLGKEKFLMGKI